MEMGFSHGRGGDEDETREEAEGAVGFWQQPCLRGGVFDCSSFLVETRRAHGGL